MSEAEVRVRFAPSPTGHFHIGSARTALFNWLYARHRGGKFILRIEDTDKERNTDEALDVLLAGLRWLGLDWDEGPEAGGDYGPYFQSQRGDIYDEYLEKLKATGRVYEKEGALFFKVSDEIQTIEDHVRGAVQRKEEKDFVIYRSNGTPVFHFVNVVDDIAMGITHIVRGEDHLSNTSKHVELFKAFGAKVPEFAHIPLILKQEGPGKMSKRDQGALIREYEQRHFLPSAVVNYLCLLGWSPKNDREILPISEIISLFNLKGISKNNARFDETKMAHVNAEHLRALPIEALLQKAENAYLAEGFGEPLEDLAYLEKVLEISQEKIRSVDSIPRFTRYFFAEDYPVDEKTFEKLTQKADFKDKLVATEIAFSKLEHWNAHDIEKTLKETIDASNSGPGPFMQGTRLAVSGQGMGPSLFPMLELLGKETVLKRLAKFIANL